MAPARRVTPAELAAARDGQLADVWDDDADCVFCGINPSLYSAAVGHHFARPGNRFWPALFDSGFTPRLLRADEDRQLACLGLGLTNLAARPTAKAAELAASELERGRDLLAAKVRARRPRVVAVLGITAFRVAFSTQTVKLGLQAHTIETASLWVLPNPSGLNAHYQRADFAEVFGALRVWLSRG